MVAQRRRSRGDLCGGEGASCPGTGRPRGGKGAEKVLHLRGSSAALPCPRHPPAAADEPSPCARPAPRAAVPSRCDAPADHPSVLRGCRPDPPPLPPSALRPTSIPEGSGASPRPPRPAERARPGEKDSGGQRCAQSSCDAPLVRPQSTACGRTSVSGDPSCSVGGLSLHRTGPSPGARRAPAPVLPPSRAPGTGSPPADAPAPASPPPPPTPARPRPAAGRGKALPQQVASPRGPRASSRRTVGRWSQTNAASGGGGGPTPHSCGLAPQAGVGRRGPPECRRPTAGGVRASWSPCRRDACSRDSASLALTREWRARWAESPGRSPFRGRAARQAPARPNRVSVMV